MALIGSEAVGLSADTRENIYFRKDEMAAEIPIRVSMSSFTRVFPKCIFLLNNLRLKDLDQPSNLNSNFKVSCCTWNVNGGTRSPKLNQQQQSLKSATQI